MRILLIHNYYGDYARGGEGNVFEQEAKMLEEHGHTVRKFSCTNAQVKEYSLIDKIKFFRDLAWSRSSYDLIKREILDFQPDIMHVHNFFLVLSPSIFRAAKDCKVPVAVSCHNYGLATACGMYLTKGKTCERCVNKNPWRLIAHRCYNNSLLLSLARYRMFYLSRKKHNWTETIYGFIVSTQFAVKKHIETGIPAERIYIKPNFIEDVQQEDLPDEIETEPGQAGALYIGRLSREKGIETLLKSWENIDFPLTIIGYGPMKGLIRKARNKNIRYLGLVTKETLIRELGRAAFVVFPSVCYEAFPLVLVESLSAGKCVAASNIGAMAEIIEPGRTGVLFEAGSAGDMREKVKFLINNPEPAFRMGQAAREKFLGCYTKEIVYSKLINIYEDILGRYRTTHRDNCEAEFETASSVAVSEGMVS